jgi:hypothetical protein
VPNRLAPRCIAVLCLPQQRCCTLLATTTDASSSPAAAAASSAPLPARTQAAREVDTAASQPASSTASAALAAGAGVAGVAAAAGAAAVAASARSAEVLPAEDAAAVRTEPEQEPDAVPAAEVGTPVPIPRCVAVLEWPRLIGQASARIRPCRLAFTQSCARVMLGCAVLWCAVLGCLKTPLKQHRIAPVVLQECAGMLHALGRHNQGLSCVLVNQLAVMAPASVHGSCRYGAAC